MFEKFHSAMDRINQQRRDQRADQIYGGTGGITGGQPINRYGPAVPPPVQVPTNNGPYGGFMGQAFSLAGVPHGQPPMPQQTPQQMPGQMGMNQLPPEVLMYLQSLFGGGQGITRLQQSPQSVLAALRGMR